MSDEDKKMTRKQILKELQEEETTENQLIWLYQTLMDLGIENCFPEGNRAFFKEGMVTLKEESEQHKIMISSVIDKYIN